MGTPFNTHITKSTAVRRRMNKNPKKFVLNQQNQNITQRIRVHSTLSICTTFNIKFHDHFMFAWQKQSIVVLQDRWLFHFAHLPYSVFVSNIVTVMHILWICVHRKEKIMRVFFGIKQKEENQSISIRFISFGSACLILPIIS